MACADCVLRGGRVRTMHPGRPKAQAVAIRQGLIIGVGSDAEVSALIGPRTSVIDLGGRVLLPSFGDAHAHVQAAVTFVHALNLYGVGSLPDYVAAVSAYSAAHPGRPAVLGNGWSEALFPGLGPSKLDLDAVECRRPVALWSDGHHSLWVNSAAMRMLGIDGATPDPATGVIERVPETIGRPWCPHGEPSGTLRESAAEAAAARLPDFTVEEYCDGIRFFQDSIAAPLGITLVHDPVLLPGCNAAAAYEMLASAGELTMRVRASLQLFPELPVGPQVEAAVVERAKHTNELFQIAAVKIFADGVLEGHTAYLIDDYADRPGYCGQPIWEPGVLDEACIASDGAGLQIHMHACGDAALAEVLDSLAGVIARRGARDRRPLVTHWQVVRADDVSRAASLGVVPLTQPYWFVKDHYYYDVQVPYLGKVRADEEYPMRSLFSAGMRPASSSDFPVTPAPNPLAGIQGGVMRWLPEPPLGASIEGPGVLWPAEAVTAQQMAESFTLNVAYANFLEETTGSLEVGKSADMVVLESDPLECEPEAIAAGSVLLTIFRGREVYRHPSFGEASS